MLEQLRLNGKTVIVTGGGSGLGREMVRHLARAGADIVIAARRPGPIEEAAQEVRAMNRKALAIPTDITDSAQVNDMIGRTLEVFPRVDVLINNAGLGEAARAQKIWEISDEDWRKGIDVNLTGAFYCSRAVAKHMVDNGRGKIINVASGFGLRGGRDNYMYCCAKGGVLQLTRSITMSLSRFGIICTGIVPGFIPTAGTEAIREMMPRGDFIPTGRAGKPSEIGPVSVFLASDASDYMNGEFFALDGGGLAAGFAPTGYAGATSP